MFSNRPLYATRADSQWYTETGAGRKFADSVANWHNTLLIGDPGAGKSSVLHMTELRLRDERRPVAFVTFASVASIGHAVVALARAAAENEWIQPGEELERAAVEGDDPFAPNMLLRRLDAVPKGAVLLVDDVPGAIGHALFGRLRDELWQLEDLTWGVAASSDDTAHLVVPPADAFFETRVTLEPLSDDERLEFVERRSTRGSDSLSAKQKRLLATVGPGNPRQLATLARRVAGGASGADELVRGAEVRRERAESVGGRPAAMLVSEMEHLGPISASDERLLKRLGWTRPRAAGLLGDLEDAGVVISHVERRQGPGRPRKLYELRPIHELLGE